MRACSSSMAPAASATIRAARWPTCSFPATSSSPTTPRRCRRASSGRHLATGAAIEVRLAGRRSLAADDVACFLAVVFGAGDWRTRTEDRPLPPPLAAGDTLALGPLAATVVRVVAAPRLVELRFAGAADAIRAGIARHGRPVQYAHVAAPLALWDVWTAIAAQPVAFEPPSAGFVLDWRLLDRLGARGIGFATLTHAAGLSSTGDAALDARLPFDEPYHLPAATVAAVQAARERGDRVVAIGTTVARALEHAAAQPGGLRAGPGVATNRLGRSTRLGVVDALVSGTHEPGLEPSRAAARVRRRRDARPDRCGARHRLRPVPHARVRRLGAGRARRRAALAYAEPRSNLKTATLASRLGSVRTTLPA